VEVAWVEEAGSWVEAEELRVCRQDASAGRQEGAARVVVSLAVAAAKVA
jgi:hypothetical protein